ncbi:MAG TPA: SMC-Scp complex subunit ScpB [Myxococcota bacterium]|nr:SMC-Scp complex subunit ScpB [Myxococcota bacterium]
MSDDNVIQFPGPSEGPEWMLPMLEALLFAAGEPVSVSELCTAIGEVAPDEVRAGLHELARQYLGRGIRVVRVGGGWQMRTEPSFTDAVLRLRGGKAQRMSAAALETLAVVAYRQPVTRHEIDEIRGVGSGGVVKTLLEKGYLRVMGRRDEPGRPLEYGTTPTFLEMFELDSLAGLPTLAEREELAREQESAELPKNPLHDAGPPADA